MRGLWTWLLRTVPALTHLALIHHLTPRIGCTWPHWKFLLQFYSFQILLILQLLFYILVSLQQPNSKFNKLLSYLLCSDSLCLRRSFILASIFFFKAAISFYYFWISLASAATIFLCLYCMYLSLSSFSNCMAFTCTWCASAYLPRYYHLKMLTPSVWPSFSKFSTNLTILLRI